MILLDTHVVFWVLCDPSRLSDAAASAVGAAAQVAVAGITWYELAWLIDAGRIQVEPDPASWLRDAAAEIVTLPSTWDIAHRAAGLSRHPVFPKDPADRLIYATAVVHDTTLVTRDDQLRAFDGRTCAW